MVICGPIINVDGFSRGDSTSKAVGVSNFDGNFLVGCMINHKEDGSIECAARCKNQTLFFEDSFFFPGLLYEFYLTHLQEMSRYGTSSPMH